MKTIATMCVITAMCSVAVAGPTIEEQWAHDRSIKERGNCGQAEGYCTAYKFWALTRKIEAEVARLSCFDQTKLDKGDNFVTQGNDNIRLGNTEQARAYAEIVVGETDFIVAEALWIVEDWFPAANYYARAMAHFQPATNEFENASNYYRIAEAKYAAAKAAFGP